MEDAGVAATSTATTPPAAPPAAAPALPAARSAWSDEDERAFQTLATRRKAAGYSRRGRDVSDQSIWLGMIKPNPNTVAAVIYALVAEHGATVVRSRLIELMAGATFPHPKARPADKEWCQGYIAGALRAGFLLAGADLTAASQAAS